MMKKGLKDKEIVDLLLLQAQQTQCRGISIIYSLLLTDQSAEKIKANQKPLLRVFPLLPSPPS